MADAAENRRGHRRPTALTADVADVIVATVAGGGTLGEAARAAGVSERTLGPGLPPVARNRRVSSSGASSCRSPRGNSRGRRSPQRLSGSARIGGAAGLDPLADVFAEVDPDYSTASALRRTGRLDTIRSSRSA